MDWTTSRDQHRRRVQAWVEAHRDRAARGEKHPVYDFLFTYYSFRPSHLLRWSPGVDVILDDCQSSATDWPTHFVDDNHGCSIPASGFPEHRRQYLHWAINYLESVRDSEPVYHCFGLHEWAMIYEADAVRHETTPLRLSRSQIADVVRGQGLRCTHYDAFRFFTPAAVPLNRVALTRADAGQHDQPGCIHANMDLYKFAYTVAPFTSAEILADCFELARIAREIDMKASPYDLAAMGFKAIPIETRDGQEQYIAEQKRLLALAQPLRRRVLAEYRYLLARCDTTFCTIDQSF